MSDSIIDSAVNVIKEEEKSIVKPVGRPVGCKSPWGPIALDKYEASAFRVLKQIMLNSQSEDTKIKASVEMIKAIAAKKSSGRKKSKLDNGPVPEFK